MYFTRSGGCPFLRFSDRRRLSEREVVPLACVVALRLGVSKERIWEGLLPSFVSGGLVSASVG